MADESDDGAPEEFTLVEGRDAAESARKQEQDTGKRLVSEAKQKRRKQDERNREAKLKKMEDKKKTVESGEQEEEDDDSDFDAGFAAMKSSGFLDESIVQFLVDKEKKEATTLSEARPHGIVAESRPRRKPKKKLSSVSIDERTKLVVLKDPQTHARRGSEFFKQRLHGSHIKRSTAMLKPRKKIFK